MKKLVVVSDTHGQVVRGMPDADFLIHCGDWSRSGAYQDTHKFIRWLESIRHKFNYIICVPGNHDIWVEQNQLAAKKMFGDIGAELLIHEQTTLDGVNFYGMPLSPEFGRWAFMAPLDKRKQACDAIPEGIDVLVTHSPPSGYLDVLSDKGSEPGKHAGCAALTAAIYRVQPTYALCGHIHEGAGIARMDSTILVNAAMMDETYQSVNAFKVVYL